MPPAEFAAWARRLGDDRAAKLATDWAGWRRGAQCPPEGDWHVWMLLQRRGVGTKTTRRHWLPGPSHAHPGARTAMFAARPHDRWQGHTDRRSDLPAESDRR